MTTPRYDVRYLGVLSPRPTVYRDGKAMLPEEVAVELNRFYTALERAHSILLHEMDNGRTPTMLRNVGLGYFEDVLSGLDAEWRVNRPAHQDDASPE